jgi:hypothetical protein
MSRSFLDDDRLVDLLAERATDGLDAAAEAELAERLAAYPGVAADAFATPVAALSLASRAPVEPLPPGLRARLLAAVPPPVARLEPRARARAPDYGWWAAAAALVLAIAGWYPRLVPTPEARTSDAERFAALAGQPGVVRSPFAPTADPGGQGASGEVVWDPRTQTGYMRFRRLPANDPAQHQYQLWIFDAGRDDRYPVDGGVFDIRADEVIVPIHARLRVGRPVLFAVTVERRGGVVVSGREHIVVAAKPTST